MTQTGEVRFYAEGHQQEERHDLRDWAMVAGARRWRRGLDSGPGQSGGSVVIDNIPKSCSNA